MTWKLAGLAAGCAMALAGCDPPPKVDLVNGAGAAVFITHVPRATPFYEADAKVRVAPGATGRFILPWKWTSGKLQPTLEFMGCEYRYELPRQGMLFGYPALDSGIGQWSGLQFESDGSIYVRERHPTGVATLSELAPKQPAGWPLHSARRACR